MLPPPSLPHDPHRASAGATPHGLGTQSTSPPMSVDRETNLLQTLERLIHASASPPLPPLRPFPEEQRTDGDPSWDDFFELYELHYRALPEKERVDYLCIFLKGPALARFKCIPRAVDPTDYQAMKPYLKNAMKPLSVTTIAKLRNEFNSFFFKGPIKTSQSI